DETHATLASPAVAQKVLRDRDQVRAERPGRRTVAVEMSERSEEGLLRDVLRFLPSGDARSDDAVHRRPFGTAELLEGGSIAALRARQDACFGHGRAQWTTAQTRKPFRKRDTSTVPSERLALGAIFGKCSSTTTVRARAVAPHSCATCAPRGPAAVARFADRTVAPLVFRPRKSEAAEASAACAARVVASAGKTSAPAGQCCCTCAAWVAGAARTATANAAPRSATTFMLTPCFV